MKNHTNISKIIHWLFWGLGLLGLLVSLSFENLYLSIWLFSLYSFFLIIFYNDKSFTHPILVFTLFYYPYSTWYVFQTLAGSFYDAESLLLVIQYSYVGIIGFTSAGILFGFKSSLKKCSKSRKFAPISIFNSSFVFDSVFWLIVVMFVISIIETLVSGAESKRDIINANMLLMRFTGFMAIFLTILVSIHKKTDIDRKGKFYFRDYRLIITFCLFVLFYLIAGERDYVFRFIFVMIMMYFHSERSATNFKLFFIFVGTVLVMPISQALKAIFLSITSVTWKITQLDVFGGEFFSAGRNLYMVIFYDADGGYTMLLNDFLRGVIPFSSKFGFESLGFWYDKIFRIDNDFSGTSGWGFSLVAEGYVVDGGRGVFIVLFMVSCVLHVLYRRMHLSMYWFVFYLLALSTSIYCIRADVANFVSQTFKVSGITVFTLWMCTVTFTKILHSKQE